LLAVLAATTLVGNPSVFAADDKADSLVGRAQFRRPTDVAWLGDGRRLLVLNRRSGSISVVDADRQSVVSEQRLGEQPTAIAALPEADRFVVVDEKTHEILLIHVDENDELVIDGRTATSSYPVEVAVSADGTRAAVACLWSHAIDVVALQPAESETPPETWNAAFPRVVGSIALPFAPRRLVVLPNGCLAVLDAFGDFVAVVDLARREIVSLHRLNAHNLGGTAVDGERRELIVTGQHLEQSLPTSAAVVKGGRLIRNQLLRISLDHLVRQESLAGDAVAVTSLDTDSRGAGDPAGIALIGSTTLVCLGGVGRLASLDAEGAVSRSWDVGLAPVQVTLDPTGRRAYVVNRLSDSVSIVDLSDGAVTEISLGPQPEAYPRDRGEQMFFDARLSPGGFFSCHSCHTDGHTNGLLADTLGDGAYGTPKRILTLRGTSLTDHWAWNGTLRELREQVRQSLETTMHAAPMSAERHDDVAAVLHTLPFPPPLLPTAKDDADHRLVERGRALFAAWRCGDCHVGPLTYTSQPTYDVGLRDEQLLAKFNPPSLRGVGQNAAFFHDNRAQSLEEVFEDYRHQLPEKATDDDVTALVRFLRSL
jgi:YVTN family beta-propeller protein